MTLPSGVIRDIRQEEWTSGIDVGLFEYVKALLGFRAKGMDALVRRSRNQKKQLAFGT
jgi:hypothetical protein